MRRILSTALTALYFAAVCAGVAIVCFEPLLAVGG